MNVVERAPSAIFIGAEPSGKPESTQEPWFLDPREVVRTLRSRWKLVLCPVLVLGAAALAWLLLVPPQFAASTQILIDPRGLQVVKDGVNPPDQANDASLLLVDSQMRVLTSDDVLKRVVQAFDLEHDPEFSGPQSLIDVVRARLSALFGRTDPETDPKLSALRTLRDRTGARRMERSFVIELGVTTKDREKSARLAQAVAETYLAAEAEARAQATRKAGAALSSRLGELQEAVRRAEDQAQAYRAAHNIVGTRAQLVSEQQLTQLSDQLGAARARVAEQRARLNQIEALARGAVNFDAVTEVVQSATIGQLRGQLAQLEALRADTASNLGPRHPTLRTIEVQVSSLRGQIDAEIRRIGAAVRNEYKAALANEAALAATLEKRKSEALTTGENFVRLRELERQVDASRAVYEAFLVRTRELQEQQRLDTSTSRVISPASPPARRLGPPTWAVLAASLAAGLGLGVLGALLAESAAGRVRSRRRLEQATGLRVIGSLPKARLTPDASTPPQELSSGYGVALARLRDRLRRDLPGAPPVVVIVTSADDSLGKSMLALGLASSAALEGERVLLVDADPEAFLTSHLGLRAERSIDDVLQSRALLADALVNSPSGFSLLPGDGRTFQAGAGPLATRILGMERAFDFIIVNVGLLGADVAAERFMQDQRVSALLLTVSAEHSALAPVRRALDLLGHEPRLRLVVTDQDAPD